MSFILLAAAGQARASGFGTYYAALDANGEVSQSLGVQTTARTAAGVYDVTFKPLVNDCGFTVSVTGPTPGFASANRKTGRLITVSTFSKNGVAANLPSTIILVCGP
jgi:hypothetical protein